MAAIHVLCVDTSPDIRAILSTLLHRAPDLECVGTLRAATDLAEEAEACGADIVVIDPGMPHSSALAKIREFAHSGCAARLIVFTGDNDDDCIQRCLEAGADACVPKGTDPRLLLDAIRKVARDAAQGLVAQSHRRTFTATHLPLDH